MKITKVDVFYPQEKLEPVGQDWRPILCRIYTDEGVFGDGEGAMAYCNGGEGAYAILKDLAKLIIGMDPLDNEVIWNKLYRETFWGQNGGPTFMSAISAIDIALWDIKGKHFGVPIYKLLGGKRQDNLRTYASQLQFGWHDEYKLARSDEEYVEHVRLAVEEGYDAVKIDFFMFKDYDEDEIAYNTIERTTLLPPKRLNKIVNRVRAVREAFPDIDIIVENHSFLDAQSAVQLGRALEPFNIFYFEEPNTPDPKTNKYICDSLNMPIASGERIYTRWQYAKYFEDQSIQVIQPDLGNCGGITEVKKICDMAYTYDVAVQIHVCSSPLCTAAALNLEAVIPNFVIHEHHVFNRFETNKKLCKYDYQPENGRYKVPERPGIGNELSDYVINGPKETIE